MTFSGKIFLIIFVFGVCLLRIAGENDLNPHYGNAFYRLGEHIERKGDLKKAFKYYQKAIKINPKLALAYHSIGKLLLTSGKYDQAKQYFLKSTSLDKEFHQAYNDLGLLEYEQGRYTAALTYFSQAIELRRGYKPVEYYYNRALVYVKLGDPALINQEIEELDGLGAKDLAGQVRALIAFNRVHF